MREDTPDADLASAVDGFRVDARAADDKHPFMSAVISLRRSRRRLEACGLDATSAADPNACTNVKSAASHSFTGETSTQAQRDSLT